MNKNLKIAAWTVALATGVAVLYVARTNASYAEDRGVDLKTAALEQMANYNVGDVAPDLAYPDPSGKIIKLSSLRGKMVLLDFWASWCSPCRMENPNVVRVYNQYKDAKFISGKGFTVYSYSLDQNKDRWVAAIAQDQLAWPNHTSDLKGWNAEGAGVYGVRSIPMTYLLDGEGKIIAKGLRGPALEEKLKSLLK
jgi:thiol-disulfide isomerase/thioredoxin